MINWKQVAEMNGLSIEEFEKEILTVAAAVGAMQLDKSPGVDAIRFYCSDELGPITLEVKRGEK